MQDELSMDQGAAVSAFKRGDMEETGTKDRKVYVELWNYERHP